MRLTTKPLPERVTVLVMAGRALSLPPYACTRLTVPVSTIVSSPEPAPQLATGLSLLAASIACTSEQPGLT